MLLWWNKLKTKARLLSFIAQMQLIVQIKNFQIIYKHKIMDNMSRNVLDFSLLNKKNNNKDKEWKLKTITKIR